MTHPKDLSRRAFLRRAGGAAIAIPSLAAILAACEKPGQAPAGGSGSQTYVVAAPDNPVTLPTFREPIATDTPLEAGPLQVYNWADYMWKKTIADFEKEFDTTIEVTTFNNLEEGIAKLSSGQVKPDVFFPTPGYLNRLGNADLLLPLNHELIPNMDANVWPSFSDPGPYYDRGWQYSVPYTIYTTGVAYRRDVISDEDAAAQGYALLWNPDQTGKISYYDSYGDAIAMAILYNGDTDVNTGDPAVIERAKESILTLVNDYDARLTINGTYAKLPAGEFNVSQSWSGDIVGAQWYLPKGTGTDVLGYWFPEDKKGLISNDTLVIPATAERPALAHAFLNYILDEQAGYDNFVNWNGYQPPFTSIEPSSLIDEGVIPSTLPMAVVDEEMFTTGIIQTDLPPADDQVWQDAWAEIKAGA